MGTRHSGERESHTCGRIRSSSKARDGGKTSGVSTGKKPSGVLVCTSGDITESTLSSEEVSAVLRSECPYSWAMGATAPRGEVPRRPTSVDASANHSARGWRRSRHRHSVRTSEPRWRAEVAVACFSFL